MSDSAYPLPKGRLLSLDVMRGLTMMSMVLVNNPGTWQHVYPPLLHAEWHGCTFTDLIFPFFLFMVGVAMPFSFEKRLQQGVNPNSLLPRIIFRTVVLYLIGMALSIFPSVFHDPSRIFEVRIPGVLQRIALCYFFVSLMALYLKATGRIVAGCVLVAVYSIGMWFVPVPGYGAGIFEPYGNLCWYLDNLFLEGHTWGGAPAEGFDPEGIWSTLTAICTTLAGYITGIWIRTPMDDYRRLAMLLLFGILGMMAGYGLSPLMPINKQLWTTSYLFLVTGMALCTLGLLYYMIDMRKWQKGLTPFLVFGTNAIFAYVLSSALASVLGYYGIKSWIFESVFLQIASPINASLLMGLSYVLLIGLITYALYRKRIFLRL